MKKARIALIIGGFTLAGIALAGSAWGDLDLGMVPQFFIGVGALLAGLGIDLRGGAAALLILVTSCAPCQTESTVVDALDVGLSVAEDQLPDNEQTQEALSWSRGAVDLGQAAVDACELLRDGEGWRSWTAWALESTRGVLELFGAASEPSGSPPPELTRAVELLESETTPLGTSQGSGR